MSESKAERRARENFYNACMGKGGCWIARKVTPHTCDGPLDPCHIIAKQGLKIEAKVARMAALDALDLIWDQRNGIPICREWHSRMDNGHLRIYQPELPSSVQEFVQEWDERLPNEGALRVRLDRHYPREDRAQ